MSRAHSLAPRAISLTDELDKLEQSITLTLQEIDHNFSRAHRIVTTSILPIVERYAEHSNAVWEGSKFWKQFFEASANVSLSGVEEHHEEENEKEQDEEPEPEPGEDNEESSYVESPGNTNRFTATLHSDDSSLHPDERHRLHGQVDDTLLNNPDISGSTPRVSKQGNTPSERFRRDFTQALKLEPKMSPQGHGLESPETPKGNSWTPDPFSIGKLTSPYPSDYLESMMQKRTGGDVLLHRVLDKNYRLQATPHTMRVEPKAQVQKESWRNLSSPISSPPDAAPQLHTDLFSSPVRHNRINLNAPRTPGISVQTPAKGRIDHDMSRLTKNDEITWESDSDEDAEGVYRELGLSPPKTIQFNLPQSRLLQTPAREASRRIVQDLLTTARGGFELSDQEDSPSIVARDNLDDSL
ncbi:hypothetical protein K3495_g2126 [Podosphaera aphanis]|nr:hypothetical protein K3495_g2126 [Podosphaera aphanis]